MDSLKGWAIDLEAVYGGFWKDKGRFHLSEALWESPDGSTAALLYGIGEVGVSKEVGRLAILGDKGKPEVVLNLPRLVCWHLHDETVQFGRDGVLFVHAYEPGKDGIRALDLPACRLARLDALPRIFHHAEPVEGTRYAFSAMTGKRAERTVLDLKDLRWRDIPLPGTIHPALRRDVRINRWVGMPLMASFAVCVQVAAGRAFLRGEGTLLQVLLFSLPFTLLFSWAAWYAWSSAGRYARATWVLSRTAPIPVRIDLKANRRGGLAVRLFPLEGNREGWQMICRNAGAAPVLRNAEEIRAHIDPVPGGPIVLATPSGLIWSLSGTPTGRAHP